MQQWWSKLRGNGVGPNSLSLWFEGMRNKKKKLKKIKRWGEKVNKILCLVIMNWGELKWSIFLHGLPYSFLLNWEENETDERVRMIRPTNKLYFLHFLSYKPINWKEIFYHFSSIPSPLSSSPSFPFSPMCSCQTHN